MLRISLMGCDRESAVAESWVRFVASRVGGI
jgi:hypothetical protein